jgi:hypothetical protein
MPSNKQEEQTLLISSEQELVYVRGDFKPWGEYENVVAWRLKNNKRVEILAKNLQKVEGPMAESFKEALIKRHLDEKRKKAETYSKEHIREKSIGSTNGDLLIYDENINFKAIFDHIFFSTAENEPIRIRKSKTKGLVIRERDNKRITSAISCYENWIAKLEVETPRDYVYKAILTDQERYNIRVSIKHKEFLESMGKQAPPSYAQKFFRETFCWRCKNDLSTISNLACLTCNGLICSCGACLCGRPSPQ